MDWEPPATGALPVGQVSDYVCSAPLDVAPYGRLHGQVWPDGTATIHVDTFNPDRGVVSFVAHAVFDVVPFLLSKVPVLGCVFSPPKTYTTEEGTPK